MKGWVYGTSPELWGKCRECQSKAELRAGKKALDGGCALESALSLLPFFSLPSATFAQLCLTFGRPQGAPAAPGLSWRPVQGGSSVFRAEKELWGTLFLRLVRKKQPRSLFFPAWKPWRTSIFVRSPNELFLPIFFPPPFYSFMALMIAFGD